MLYLRLSIPNDLTDTVIDYLDNDAAVSSLSVHHGAAMKPPGDVVHADVAREAANAVIDRLRELGVQRRGSIHIQPVPTWLSQHAFEAEQRAPGSSADAVVWADVGQRAYDDTELNWTFLSFMTLATLIAGIAIILDSQILVIGAMVLGPEFGAVAALGVALVRKRPSLLRRAAVALAVGFAVAIAATTVAALVGRAIGWVHRTDVLNNRPGTSFIYAPDHWSFVVAVIAAAAGVLSLTSAKVGGLTGVFISVTTIPAAGNVALGLAFWAPHEIIGSTEQLAINLTGMAIAGWLTLLAQQAVWRRVAHQGRPSFDRLGGV